MQVIRGVVVEERDLIPEITPYLKIKFPTADEDRGLGTGEVDETLGVAVSKRLIDALFGYLTLSYTFIGDPPGADFRNPFGWSLGAAYAVLQPLSVFAFLEGSTAITRGQADPVELRVGAEFTVIRALKLTGSVTRGLTDGAADSESPWDSRCASDNDRVATPGRRGARLGPHT